MPNWGLLLISLSLEQHVVCPCHLLSHIPALPVGCLGSQLSYCSQPPWIFWGPCSFTLAPPPRLPLPSLHPDSPSAHSLSHLTSSPRPFFLSGCLQQLETFLCASMRHGSWVLVKQQELSVILEVVMTAWRGGKEACLWGWLRGTGTLQVRVRLWDRHFNHKWEGKGSRLKGLVEHPGAVCSVYMGGLNMRMVPLGEWGIHPTECTREKEL